MDRRRFTQALGAALVAGPLKPDVLSALSMRVLRGLGVNAPTRLRDINTTNLVDAVRLGCGTMSRLFDVDHDNRPYSVIRLRPTAQFNIGNFSDAQVPGRHLHALLSAERNMRVTLDESTVEKHTRTAFNSFSGVLPLPLNRAGVNGKLDLFRPVDLAHAFNALYSLVAFRQSTRAQDVAERCIATCLDLWDPEKGWKRDVIESHTIRYNDPFPEAPFIAGIAMALGPLSRYEQLTKSPNAGRLVRRLRDRLLDGFFVVSGEYDPMRLGSHVHNIVYTLASLAQHATLAADNVAKERVQQFYDVGLKEMSNEIGWAMEFAGPHPSPGFPPQSMFPDKGELGNTAKILETALELGRWGGAHYYDDAERIIRGHVLPSQFRDMSFMEDPPNPDGSDDHHNVRERIRGAWGYSASYGLMPYGRGPDGPFMLTTADVVGAVVSALVEASAHASTFAQNTHMINLWFDSDTPDLTIKSPYVHATLQVTAKKPGPIYVRRTRWLRDSELTGVNGLKGGDHPGYARLEQRAGGPITIPITLAPHEVQLTCRDRHIRAQVRGDEISAMQNLGSDWTFFETMS